MAAQAPPSEKDSQRCRSYDALEHKNQSPEYVERPTLEVETSRRRQVPVGQRGASRDIAFPADKKSIADTLIRQATQSRISESTRTANEVAAQKFEELLPSTYLDFLGAPASHASTSMGHGFVTAVVPLTTKPGRGFPIGVALASMEQFILDVHIKVAKPWQLLQQAWESLSTRSIDATSPITTSPCKPDVTLSSLLDPKDVLNAKNHLQDTNQTIYRIQKRENLLIAKNTVDDRVMPLMTEYDLIELLAFRDHPSIRMNRNSLPPGKENGGTETDTYQVPSFGARLSIYQAGYWGSARQVMFGIVVTDLFAAASYLRNRDRKCEKSLSELQGLKVYHPFVAILLHPRGGMLHEERREDGIFSHRQQATKVAPANARVNENSVPSPGSSPCSFIGCLLGIFAKLDYAFNECLCIDNTPDRPKGLKSTITCGTASIRYQAWHQVVSDACKFALALGGFGPGGLYLGQGCCGKCSWLCRCSKFSSRDTINSGSELPVWWCWKFHPALDSGTGNTHLDLMSVKTYNHSLKEVRGSIAQKLQARLDHARSNIKSRSSSKVSQIGSESNLLPVSSQ